MDPFLNRNCVKQSSTQQINILQFIVYDENGQRRLRPDYVLIQDDPEDFREENVSAVGTSEDGQNHVKEGSSNDNDVEGDIQFCSEPIPVDSKN